jgi:hypothetical protein
LELSPFSLTIQDAEIDQHAKLIPTDPFFRNLSIVKPKNCDRWPTDRLSRHRVCAETTRPFAAIHRSMAQSACHAIVFLLSSRDSLL